MATSCASICRPSPPHRTQKAEKQQVTHKTSYVYADAVSSSHHLAHLAPRGGEGRQMLAHEVAITPQPSVSRERLDYFGNRTLYFSVREPHRSLDVVATSLVDIAPLSPPRLEQSPPWEEIRDRLRGERRRDLLDAFSFTFDSPYINLSENIHTYAAPSFPTKQPKQTTKQKHTHHNHKNNKNKTNTTKQTTSID